MQDAEEFCIDDEEDEEEKKSRPVVKNAMDLQRLKLEKLMKNPDKPIIIPEPPKEKDFMQTVPTFVRNVMGSSAGAGSGEFHVYRHLRRKEYARQKYIQAKSIREQLDDEYRQRIEQNRLAAEAKTAKRRAKRLKKKQKRREKGKRPRKEADSNEERGDNLTESSESESCEEHSAEIDTLQIKDSQQVEKADDQQINTGIPLQNDSVDNLRVPSVGQNEDEEESGCRANETSCKTGPEEIHQKSTEYLTPLQEQKEEKKVEGPQVRMEASEKPEKGSPPAMQKINGNETEYLTPLQEQKKESEVEGPQLRKEASEKTEKELLSAMQQVNSNVTEYLTPLQEQKEENEVEGPQQRKEASEKTEKELPSAMQEINRNETTA